MFGVVSGVSVGSLLMAGFVPGIIMGLALMLQVSYMAHRHNMPTSRAYPLKEMLKTVLPDLSAMSIVIIVLGGLYSGIMTPTEAAIFAISSCFSYAITFENIPSRIAAFLLGLTSNKYVLLLLVNLMLLIIGCFMEGLSAVMIVTPMLLPALQTLGVDPIQVGVIFAVNTTLGLLTPPFGLSLFMASSVTDLPVMTISRKVIPQFVVLLCLYYPSLQRYFFHLIRFSLRRAQDLRLLNFFHIIEGGPGVFPRAS